VTVYDLRIINYHYPELTLEVECGTGTYIRSLGRDLAQAMGTHAVMAGLERQWVGNLHISESLHVEDLEAKLEEHMLSPHFLVDSLTWVRLTQEEIRHLRHGRAISRGDRRIEPRLGS
jgi:tRNA pseudouridine55 synthase